MSEQFDIAVIGGGMVGASLALALAQAPLDTPLRIAVFEAFALPDTSDDVMQPSYDARATALAYGSRCLLEQLDIWSDLSPQAEPIRRIEVTNRGHFGAARLDADAEGVPALGYVVENRRLGAALLARIEQLENVEFICPAEVIGAHFDEGGVAIRYSDASDQPHQCRASLLVVADGGRSPLRQQLQIDYVETPYEQCAVITNLSLDRAHQGVAYERFTDEGPVALLPLGDDEQGLPRAALVWSVPIEQADEVLAWSDTQFIEQLQQRFGYRAGCIVRIGERHSYPLKLARVKEQVRRGVVVLGNAAHTLHPIAGQGFNLALRGAMALADEIVAQAQQRGDLNDPAVLRRYVASQCWDQDKTIGFSDKVTRLFSNYHLGAAVVRNLGLLALDLLPPAKRAFALSAMGLDQPLPRHLRS